MDVEALRAALTERGLIVIAAGKGWKVSAGSRWTFLDVHIEFRDGWPCWGDGRPVEGEDIGGVVARIHRLASGEVGCSNSA